MRIRAVNSFQSYVCVIEQTQGRIFESHDWPRGLAIDHLLSAICGMPDNEGWYPYHECDSQWIERCLEVASLMDRNEIGTLAISDPVNLMQTPECMSQHFFGQCEPSVSQIAAASLAVRFFASAWEATVEEASDLVRMNLFSERVAA